MSKFFISIKFGGTSMGSAESIIDCAKIIKEKLKKYSLVVTVSAVAGVTNELQAFINLAKKQKPRRVRARIAALKKQHEDILKKLVPQNELEHIWQQDFLPLFSKLETILVGTSLVGDTTPKTEARILSFGEKLSSHLMAQALNKLGIANKRIESEKIIKTDSLYLEANVKFKATNIACRKVIKPLLTKKIVPVVTGFIGKDTHGNTTLLGRGGSDYTASIVAIGIDAQKIEIWTDVNGIMSTDPKIVPNAISWPILDMGTVAEMAYSGARVIHPKSITAAINKNIPVYILNTFNQDFPGTKVTLQKIDGIKGIIASQNHTVLNIENPNMLEAVGFLATLTKTAQEHNISIDVCATSETTFTFSIKSKDYSSKFLKNLRQLANVVVLKNIAKISIIGDDITNNTKLLADIFTIFARNQIIIHALSIGASTNNITILIADNHREKTLKLLHQKLIG